ncbi:MAG: diguanylate cyclase [Candidatus Omnitrophota bacterium]
MAKLRIKFLHTFFITSVLPMLVVCILTVGFIARMAINDARQKVINNLNIAESIYKNTGSELKYIIRDHNRRVSSLLDSGHLELLGKELETVSREHNFDFFVVTDKQGKIRAYFDGERAAGVSLSSKVATVSGKEAIASSELIDAELLIIKAGIPVINRKEEIIGMMSAGYLLNNNERIIIDEIKRATGLISSIFADSRRISSSVPSKKSEYAVGTSLKSDRAREALKKGERYIGRMSVLGRWYIAGYTPIYNGARQVIGILGIGIPEASIFVLRNRLIGIFSVVVLFSIILSFFFGTLRGSQIVASIKKLHLGAEEVSQGNFEHVIHLHTKDELEELAHFFNKMTHQLKHTRQRLKDSIEHLEKEKYKLEIILKAYNEINNIMILNDLADFVTDKAVQIVEAEKSSLMLIDEASGELVLKGLRGLDRQGVTIRTKIGELIAGWVAQQGNALLVKDIDEDPRLKGFRKKETYKSKSFISLPLKAENKVIGVMNVTDKIAGTGIFNEEDLRFLSLLAFETVAQIENIRILEKLSSLAITDALTGLNNHRHFQGQIVNEIIRAERYNHPLSIIMFDIDSFKAYNDFFGHLEGDRALKFFSAIMKKNVRNIDVISRYGGEEFVVILPDTGISGARVAAEKIRQAVEKESQERLSGQINAKITVSAGVAGFKKGMTKDELIIHADRALYMAKSEGRNKVCVFQDKKEKSNG